MFYFPTREESAKYNYLEHKNKFNILTKNGRLKNLKLWKIRYKKGIGDYNFINRTLREYIDIPRRTPEEEWANHEEHIKAHSEYEKYVNSLE